MQNLGKKFSNLPTMEDDIKEYSVQELNQYDPELLNDENENKHFMICDRKLLLDLRSMRSLLENFIEKDKSRMDKVAMIKMLLEKI